MQIKFFFLQKMLLLLLKWIIDITAKEIHLKVLPLISKVFWRGGVSRNVLSQEVDLWPRHLKSFKVQKEHFNYFDLWTFFPDKNCLENGEPDTSTMKLGDPAFTKHLVRTKQREKNIKTQFKQW